MKNTVITLVIVSLFLSCVPDSAYNLQDCEEFGDHQSLCTECIQFCSPFDAMVVPIHDGVICTCHPTRLTGEEDVSNPE